MRNCFSRKYTCRSKETRCRFLEETKYKAHDENNNKNAKKNIQKKRKKHNFLGGKDSQNVEKPSPLNHQISLSAKKEDWFIFNWMIGQVDAEIKD